MINPSDYKDVLGAYWVRRAEDPVLTIGKRQWTRYDLVSKVGVGNFRAVTILLDALQQLNVRDMDTLWKTNPVALAAIKGVGTTTLFVVLSLLESEGFKVRDWYSEHRTFESMKHAEERRKERERREQRAERRRRKTEAVASVRKTRKPYGLRELTPH